jgi:hypothetical protein
MNPYLGLNYVIPYAHTGKFVSVVVVCHNGCFMHATLDYPAMHLQNHDTQQRLEMVKPEPRYWQKETGTAV